VFGDRASNSNCSISMARLSRSRSSPKVTAHFIPSGLGGTGCSVALVPPRNQSIVASRRHSQSRPSHLANSGLRKYARIEQFFGRARRPRQQPPRHDRDHHRLLFVHSGHHTLAHPIFAAVLLRLGQLLSGGLHIRVSAYKSLNPPKRAVNHAYAVN